MQEMREPENRTITRTQAGAERRVSRTESRPDASARRPRTAEERRQLRARASEDRQRMAAALTAVVLILVLLVGNIIKKDTVFSANENRNLAQKPAFSMRSAADGSFMRDEESYVSDQFLLRDRFVEAASSLRYLSGERQLSGVYTGKKGMLLAEPEAPDEEALARTASAIRAFAADHPDVACTVLTVPCAAAVFPKMLPSGAPVRDQLADIAAFYESLGSGVRTIDASEALSAGDAQKMYYTTDHHWTTEGAYRVYENAAAAMALSPVPAYSDYTVSTTFRGTLASKSGRNRETDEIHVYVPQNGVRYYVNYADTAEISSSIYVRDKLEEKDQYTVFCGGNHPLLEIRTTAETGRNLLLFKDSYANCFLPFLIQHFDRITVIDPRYYYEDFRSRLSTDHITDVLVLYSANILFSDTALADCLTQ